MQPFHIRPAGPEDIPLIRSLTYSVWPQTYAPILSQEQIGYMLDWMYSEAALTEAMRNEQEFLILYAAGEPAGFASFGPYEGDRAKLHKLYLLPALQGGGYGRTLLDHVAQTCAARGFRTLLLNVNRHNPARAFYERQGYRVIEEVDVEIGGGFFMNDFVMEKELKG